MLGSCLMSINSIKEATVYYKQAVEINPKDLETFNILGAAFLQI